MLAPPAFFMGMPELINSFAIKFLEKNLNKFFYKINIKVFIM